MDNNKNEEIKVVTVKSEYYNIQYENNFKKDICISQDIASLAFNWSLETVKQFSKNLIENHSANFFLSKDTDLENILAKKDKIHMLIQNLNKSKINKMDILELLSILPFLVEGNFSSALSAGLNIFCLEINDNVIKADELGIFLDSFFRCVVNVIIIDEEVVQELNKSVIKLDFDEIEKDVNKIFFDSHVDQLPVPIVVE